MSTPRTDAVIRSVRTSTGSVEVVDAGFAKALERELMHATALYEHIQEVAEKAGFDSPVKAIHAAKKLQEEGLSA